MAFGIKLYRRIRICRIEVFGLTAFIRKQDNIVKRNIRRRDISIFTGKSKPTRETSVDGLDTLFANEFDDAVDDGFSTPPDEMLTSDSDNVEEYSIEAKSYIGIWTHIGISIHRKEDNDYFPIPKE